MMLCLVFSAQTLSAQEKLKNSVFLGKDRKVSIEFIKGEGTLKEGIKIFKEDVVIKTDKFTLACQKAVYNEKTGTFEVSGGVQLESGEDTFTGDRGSFKTDKFTLTSQKAVYNEKTGTIEVSGGVQLESGGDTLTGESGTFNIDQQTGIINDARFFIKENNFYIDSGSIEKYGEESYLIKDFKLTTCDRDPPEWSITGSELNVTVEGYGWLHNGVFRVKDIPVFYVPLPLIFPAKLDRQSGVLIYKSQIGYSNRNGVGFELPVFWAISESADMTFYERYMADRGIMQGLELRYVSGLASKGYFNFDILSDRIEEKNMNDPDQLEISPYQRTNSGRYWLRGRIDQQLPSGIEARLDADVVSDQDYFREFEGGLSGFNAKPDYKTEFNRPVEEDNSPLRTSALRLSRDRENYSLQAASSFYQRPEGFMNDATPEPLAGLYFSMLPGVLEKVPVSFSLESDYDYIWREYGQRGHSLSLSPKVSYPRWFGKYMQFETSAAYTYDTQWLENDTGNGTGEQSRGVFYGEARLSTLLERVFDVESSHVQKIKHKMVPSLTYEYRSHRDEDKYQPWFESIDEEGSANRVVFSLDNFIDAKKVDEEGNITYSQWGNFRISQGYDIDESHRDMDPGQKKKPFEPLTAELRLMPYSKINMNTEVRWDHYKDDFSYADIALKLNVDRVNGRTDIYRFDYVYNDDGNKGFSYYVNVNLAKGFTLGSTLQRDIETDHNIEKSYWLEYKSQCWGISLGVKRYDEESSVMFGFRLSGFSD